MRRALLLIGLASLATVILAARSATPRPAGGAAPAYFAPPAQASPVVPELGGPLPEGVTLRLLATTLAENPANGTAVLRLERVLLPAGSRLDQPATAGLHLLAVEQGDVDLVGPAAVAGRYAAGAQVALGPATAYRVVNPGTEPATLLRLRLEPEPESGGPAATPPATPPADHATAPLVETILVEGVRVARGEIRLVLARVVWLPQTDTGPLIYAGPIAVAVESGRLTVAGPSGSPVELGPGGTIVSPPYTAHRAANAGADPAVAVVAGVLPAEPARAGGGLPTPAPDYQATADAQAAIVAATIADLTDREVSLASTVAAQAAAMGEADATATITSRQAAATIAALSAEGEAARATSAALGSAALGSAAEQTALAADLATAEARLAAATATIDALARAGGDGATARAVLLAEATRAAATAGEREAALAVAIQVEATAAAAAAAAQATAAAGLAAVATIQTKTDATALAALAVEATAAQVSNEELAAAATSVVASAQARAQAARGTIVAMATALAEQPPVPANTINPDDVEVTIQVDTAALVSGDEEARQDALAELRRVLDPYRNVGCRAGVVLTFGHAPEVGVGVGMADVVNGLLEDEFPALFQGAVFDALASLGPPPGQVDVRIFFFAGCVPAEAGEPQPTIAPTG